MTSQILRVLRNVFAVLCWSTAALAVILVVTLDRSWDSIRLIALVTGVAIFLGVLSLVMAAERARWILRQPADMPESLDKSEIVPALESWRERLDIETVEAFCGLILAPANAIKRIAESATPMEGHTLMSSKYTLALPRDRQETLLLPLVLRERGRMTDGLKIVNSEGKRVSSIVQREEIGYLGAIFRKLVERASGDELEAEYIRNVEPGILDALCAQESLPPAVLAVILAQVVRLRSLAAKPDELWLLGGLIRELSTVYPVLVEYEAPARPKAKHARPTVTVRFTVDQDIVLVRERFWRTEPWWRSIRKAYQNARLLALFVLGVRPNNILIPLDNANRCQSYHLQCNGVADAYLGNQYLDRPEDGSIVRRKPRRGQSFSHLYIQGGKDYQGRHFENWFFEIPPGSTGISAAIAFAAAFGLVALAWHQLNWTPNSALASASFLLGLPGAVAAFLGFSRTSGFLQGSAKARLSTIGSLATSLAGLMCAAVVNRPTPYSASLLQADLHSLPPIFIFWLVLVAIQISNLTASVAAWLFRTYLYWAAKSSYG